MKKYERKCPKCNLILKYTRKASRDSAEIKSTLCMSCTKSVWDINKDIKGFYKKCPSCEEKMYFDTREGVKYSINKNIICQSCRNKNTEKVYIRNCPVCKKELKTKNKYFFKKSKENNSKCLSCSQIGKIMSDESRKKMSDNHHNVFGENNPFYNKKHSMKTRRKISTSITKEERQRRRERCILRIKNFGRICNFNKKACDYFDILNKERNLNLQHAMNGGEVNVLGYFLDAYDKEKNIVVEYDEPKHYISGKLRKGDIKRQTDIINYLHCKFFRYNEQKDILYEVINEKDNKN